MTPILMVLIVVLALLNNNKHVRLYFSVYGAAMLGHYYSTIPIPAAGGDYYFLSAIVLISYITYFIPKIKTNLVIISVCSCSILSSLAGVYLWHFQPYSTLHELMYLGAYTVTVCYLLKRIVTDGCNYRILDTLWNLRFRFNTSIARHLGRAK